MIKPVSQCLLKCLITCRIELAQLLIDEARRLDVDGRIQFHFKSPLMSVDIDRRIAKFGPSGGNFSEACP